MMSRRFQWLSEEIASVHTKKYFLVDGGVSEDVRHAIIESDYPLPDSYKEFVLEFGNAKLYRVAGGYELGVMASPRKFVSDNGEALLLFGYHSGNRAYFKAANLRAGRESPVFEGNCGSLQKVAEGFQAWLENKSAKIKSRIGKATWKKIVKGPPPFNKREIEVIYARKLFRWKVIGHTEDNDVLFQVRNASSRRLPFLSIGIRARDGSFEGGVWLPVQNIGPGDEKTINQDCYKERARPDEIEIYDLPDPEPEDRERYWEFRAL